MSCSSDETVVYEAEEWIRDLFGDEEIDLPDFRNDEQSRKLISKIMKLNKKKEAEAKERMKTELYFTEYYSKKADEMSKKFGPTSITDLRPEVVENVNKIASVARQMKLKEPTVTNFLLGSSFLIRKAESQKEQELIAGYKLSKISQKIKDMIDKIKMLERDIEGLEAEVSKQLKTKPVNLKQSSFFKTKSKEYMKRIHKAEKQLKNLGFKPSLSHSELIKRSDLLQNLDEKVSQLNVQLESYQNLPPNETLTRFKIEEAEGDLLRLQNEFEDLLKEIF